MELSMKPPANVTARVSSNRFRGLFSVRMAITVALVFGSVVPAWAQRSSPSSGSRAEAAQDPLNQWNDSVEALLRKVWPSVVQILVTSYGAREESDRGNTSVVMGRQRSVGSGFVIDQDGYIMTNAHVVNGAQRIQVVLPPANADGSLNSALSAKSTVLPARIVGFSSEI